MSYIGDFADDATVRFMFTTHAQTGAPVAPNSAFEAADLVIYKDGSATQKTTTNGITMTSPFDSTTGLHLVAIDTSNDTGDSGFWAAGSDYFIVLVPDETVDSLAVTKVVAHFSLENRADRTALVESGVTVAQAIRYIAATICGKTSGAGTDTEIFKGIGTTTTRVTNTVSTVGERSAVTLS